MTTRRTPRNGDGPARPAPDPPLLPELAPEDRRRLARAASRAEALGNELRGLLLRRAWAQPGVDFPHQARDERESRALAEAAGVLARRLRAG